MQPLEAVAGYDDLKRQLKKIRNRRSPHPQKRLQIRPRSRKFRKSRRSPYGRQRQCRRLPQQRHSLTVTHGLPAATSVPLQAVRALRRESVPRRVRVPPKVRAFLLLPRPQFSPAKRRISVRIKRKDLKRLTSKKRKGRFLSGQCRNSRARV